MSVRNAPLTVEFVGGPKDGEILAIPGDTYPPELVLHRAPNDLLPLRNSVEIVKPIEVVYQYSGGCWYDYKGERYRE